jgi:hypothetical protein
MPQWLLWHFYSDPIYPDAWNRTPLVILFVLIAFHPSALLASGDGPQVHGPSPIGINALIIHVSSLEDANRAFDPSLVTPNLRFDTSIGTIQYARAMAIAGRHVTLTGMLRGGNSSRSSDEPGQSASSSGFADPVVAASINLFGLPPMSLEEFRTFTPGTTVNLFLSAILPLGEYDEENLVNLGANRYAFRIGLPIVYPLGQFGRETTLELVPNVHFFTENDDTGLKQDPLVTVEGHLTHDFTDRLWGAFGALWTAGGKTKIGGVQQNGAQRSLSLSASLGYEFSPRWGLMFRYGETVAQNEFGLDGTLYHLKLVTRF